LIHITSRGRGSWNCGHSEANETRKNHPKQLHGHSSWGSSQEIPRRDILRGINRAIAEDAELPVHGGRVARFIANAGVDIVINVALRHLIPHA
jgi:hypothetical protein